MVLCKFFQQGNCRFGTKCHNEHFDVKEVLKTEVESAINGKQWPFSCFGPFKDKPCIPNFIEDQSFEEIRFLCYEAKKKNYFEQFHQQFNKEAMEAVNKMKVLLQLTPEVVELVTKLYNMPSETASSGAVTMLGETNNPFAAANTTAGFVGGSSIFNNPPNNTGGGIFGSSAAGNGTFGVASTVNNNSGGIFGGGNVVNAPQSGGNFGGGANVNNNFFDAAKPHNSIFGGSPGRLFAPVANQQQPVSNAGFGLFSQATQQQPAFGQAPALVNPFVQSTQQQLNTGVFGQTVVHAAGGNLFAQAQTQSPIGTGGCAFATAAAQTQNMFVEQEQQTAMQQDQNANIFVQDTQQMQPTGGFLQQVMQQQQPAPQLTSTSSGIYSKMENLTPMEIEAFKAETFEPGKIPFSPPPREFVG